MDLLQKIVTDFELHSVSNKNIDRRALLGNPGMDKIFVRLIETPTNISPVKAAAAPAVATKKLFHPSIYFIH